MSSWWLVLLVALAACMRLGRAQADPLPLSLVNLVMNSPISSMKDLQRLLDDHSAEEEEDEGRSNGTHKRLPRSLDVQVAQQAMCKVRTEVMEVTRSMLDRTNANFLLWPLCVEVQRCSGCCNTRTLQCVPSATETRHLQMTKIKFVNRQAVYEKVVIPVEDHLTCSCKSRTSHATWPKTTPPPSPRMLTKPPGPKSHSKEDLHRHDELKHNQRLEDKETSFQSKYTMSHTPKAPVHTLTHTSPFQHTLTHAPYATRDDLSTGQTPLGATRMMSDATQHLSVQEHQTQRPEPEKAPGHHTHHSEEVPQHHTHHSESEKVSDRHSHHSEKVAEHQPHHVGMEDTIKATSSIEHARFRHHHDKTTKQQPELSQSHTTTRQNSQSDTRIQHSGQLEAPVVSYSHVEVIGQSSGQYELSGQSEVVSQQKSQSETDRTEHRRHHHHPTPTTTEHPHSTQRAVTTAILRTPPVTYTPPPTAAQRKRRRKQRRRMSKSAMRAMIMVMS